MFAALITWILCVPILVSPGWLLVRLIRDEDSSPIEEGLFALTLGTWLVSFSTVTLIGLLGLFFPVFVRLPVLLGVALAWDVLLLWRLRRRGPLGPQLRPQRFGRWDWVVSGVMLALTLVALINYDRTFFDEERCIIRSSVLPYFNYFRSGLPMMHELPQWMLDRNPFLFWNGGQREGMSFVLTPFLALFQYLGFRTCFAFHHLAVGAGTYILGRRLLGSRWLGLGAALLICLNPYTMAMVDVDDNIFALAAGSVALAFLLRRPVHWFWFMLPYGLFLGIRHEGILTLPGVLYWLRHQPLRGAPRRKRRLHLALGSLAFLFPFALYHAFLIFVHRTPYEAFVAQPAVTHSFLGLELELHGLLNWPFHEQLARSPFSAFPPLVAFPLALLAGLGVLAWALVPGGLAWLKRNHPGFFGLGLWWFLPFCSLLLIQSNWTEMDKMGIPNTVLTPAVIWVMAGLLALRQGPPALPWKRAALPLAFAVVLSLGVLGMGRVSFPVDARGFDFIPIYMPEEFPLQSRSEDPLYVEHEQHRAARLVLLPWQPGPDSPGLGPSLRVLRRRLSALIQDLREPGFAFERPNLPALVRSTAGLDDFMHFPVTSIAEARGRLALTDSAINRELATRERVVLELDLSTAPIRQELLLRPAEGPGPEPIPVDASGATRISNIPVGWTDQPVTVLLAGGYVEDITIAISYGEKDELDPPSTPGVRWVAGSGMEEPRLRLALPAGALVSIAEYTSVKPMRLTTWRLVLDEQGRATQYGPVPR
jgi:hypothetical protein